MEQVIIQKKLFFTIVGLCIIILVVSYSFYTFRKPSYRLHVCVDSGVATLIRESPNNRFEIYSANSAKNVLWCLGKYVPFFERALKSLHVKNQTIYDEIALRYRVNTAIAFPDQDNEWIIHEDFIMATQENVDILVYFRPITSPYVALKQLKSNKPMVIVSPENSEEVRKLVEKKVKLVELKNGSRISYNLSRRLR